MPFDVLFTADGLSDYMYWQEKDRKVLRRVNKLLIELQRDGAVRGLGKTKHLRYSDRMSKRIDDANRLVYYQENGHIVITSCRGHYDD